MPVRKFRNVEEMNVPHWRDAGDPVLIRAMAALWEIGRRTSKRSYPPGVHKHTSVEDMQRTQEQQQRVWAPSM